MKQLPVSILLALSVVLLELPAYAQGCCCGSTSPLVFDLVGNGIHTTSMYEPVIFDIDADGELEWVAWTNPDEDDGFLWLDANNNGKADSGAELFGNATPLPDGSKACNGFEALAVYDLPEHGGNANGRIDRGDQIHQRLQIWVDGNLNALTERGETHTLDALGIRAILLDYEKSDERDGNMNEHRYKGIYIRRLIHRGKPLIRRLAVHDVYFQTGLTTPTILPAPGSP